VARNVHGQIAGIFCRKQSAMKFADRNTPPGGCAKTFLLRPFELDIENNGTNPRAEFAIPTARSCRFKVFNERYAAQ
jgi:hypothetical protein